MFERWFASCEVRDKLVQVVGANDSYASRHLDERDTHDRRVQVVSFWKVASTRRPSKRLNKMIIEHTSDSNRGHRREEAEKT